MDLLGSVCVCVCVCGGGGGGGGGPPQSPGQRGCRGGSIFHDKAKHIRDKLRYSNLSNNMMISEL